MNESLESIINSHPFFHGMKPQHLAMLHKGAKQARFHPGDTLFKEGEPANRFFLIQQGNIALEAHEPADGTAVVQCVHEGDVIGWSWLFPPFTWHLRARALDPTKVIVLDGAHLLSMAEAHHDFGYELMKRVAQVVIQRLQSTRRQLLELEVEEALQS
jgi:CRP-like cAMP-binding protein